MDAITPTRTTSSPQPTAIPLRIGKAIRWLSIPLDSMTAVSEAFREEASARPIQSATWSQWLVSDQREASGRPDVVAFTSDVIGTPVKISGQPVVNLVA